MKRFGKAILVLSVAATLAFTSCATTAMTMTKVAEKEDVKRGLKEPRFDFIGFKVDADTLPGSSKNTYYTGSGTKTVESTKVDWYKDFAKGTCLDNFASDLEDANLAYDKTNNYIGDFSSADLRNYKSRSGSRYVTWAAVTDCACTYTQSSNNSKFISLGSTGLTLGLAGLGMGGVMYLGKDVWEEVNGDNTMEKAATGVMIGGGIVTAVSTAAMVAGFVLPAKTTFTYHSSYDIYVYDTVDKEVVYKKTVTVEPVSDEFTGSYETAGSEVNDALSKYYNQMAYNALMRTYSTLSVKEF